MRDDDSIGLASLHFETYFFIQSDGARVRRLRVNVDRLDSELIASDVERAVYHPKCNTTSLYGR